jgi:hypothetical protein
LPSFHELGTLYDNGNAAGNPDLPVGNPFSNVQSLIYWSATTVTSTPTEAWQLNFDDGLVGHGDKTNGVNRFAWCVRGGSPGPDAY